MTNQASIPPVPAVAPSAFQSTPSYPPKLTIAQCLDQTVEYCLKTGATFEAGAVECTYNRDEQGESSFDLGPRHRSIVRGLIARVAHIATEAKAPDATLHQGSIHIQSRQVPDRVLTIAYNNAPADITLMMAPVLRAAEPVIEWPFQI